MDVLELIDLHGQEISRRIRGVFGANEIVSGLRRTSVSRRNERHAKLVQSPSYGLNDPSASPSVAGDGCPGIEAYRIRNEESPGLPLRQSVVRAIRCDFIFDQPIEQRE